MKICHTCQQTYSDDVEFCPRDGARLAAQATETEVQLAAGLSRRFRIIRRLGAGGMGAVFLAEQIAVGNRPVALKVLSRKLLDDPDFLQRFQNEAASTGRIHHPNVVTIHESGQADDGTPYIAMEFLEGESLRQALTRRGPLPVPEVAEILQQAARGLNAAHKLGIIHRDLKPDNIFLTYPDDDSVAPVPPPANGRVDSVAPASPPAQVEGALAPTSPPANVQVKIVDFGIAKLRESGAHTQTGTVLGTPAYMSFEQASGMRSYELDARSDVYSLGVVVYEMLTGRTPFQSDTPVGYLRMHMQEDPPPFRTVKPDLPALPQLESVVMKALTKDRKQRYGSVMEFARAFAEATEPATAEVGAVREPPLRDPGTMSPPPVPPGCAPEPQRQVVKPRATLAPGISNPSGRKWFVVPGCLVVLLAIAAVGLWYWARSAEWGLPIRLGQTSADVDQVLGTPNDIVNATTLQQKRQELGLDAPLAWPADMEQRWYYSSGVQGTFHADRLSGVTLPAYCDYKGFIPYSGVIVGNIKLTDAKGKILQKLGTETKIEEDPLEIGTDRDKPVVWPAGTRCYWRRAGYTIEVDFLRQAQSVSDKPPLTMPKDAVVAIRVYK